MVGGASVLNWIKIVRSVSSGRSAKISDVDRRPGLDAGRRSTVRASQLWGCYNIVIVSRACYALVRFYRHPGSDNCNLERGHYCGSTSKVTTGQELVIRLHSTSFDLQQLCNGGARCH